MQRMSLKLAVPSGLMPWCCITPSDSSYWGGGSWYVASAVCFYSFVSCPESLDKYVILKINAFLFLNEEIKEMFPDGDFEIQLSIEILMLQCVETCLTAWELHHMYRKSACIIPALKQTSDSIRSLFYGRRVCYIEYIDFFTLCLLVIDLVVVFYLCQNINYGLQLQ